MINLIMDFIDYLTGFQDILNVLNVPLHVYNAIGWLSDCYSRTWTAIDHRVDGWLLMSSVKPTLLCVCLYWTMVAYGPKMMLNRRPFQLYWSLIAYNAFITILNLHIFIELSIATYRRGYNWYCQEIKLTADPEEFRIVKALHLYFISKLIEFLDTFIFIIRKKSRQLTFLHVYHHSTMFVLWWVLVRWVPGGSAAFGPLINSFVHIVMYSYYGLSVLGPNVSKYLWWKRYLTIIQLIQFSVGLYLGVNAIIDGCPFTKWTQYMLVVYMLSYLALFGRFYCITYGSSSSSGHKTKRSSVSVEDERPVLKGSYRRIVSSAATG